MSLKYRLLGEYKIILYDLSFKTKVRRYNSINIIPGYASDNNCLLKFVSTILRSTVASVYLLDSINDKFIISSSIARLWIIRDATDCRWCSR